MKRIDLHTHSNISDGSMTPEELVAHAADVGVCAIALTDHDTVAGLDRAEKQAEKLGVEFVPGVELSTECISQVHILGYYIDRRSPALLDAFERQQNERRETHKKYMELLKTHGFGITDEEVRAVAGDAGIGRAHYAKVMMDRGYVGSVKEAFEKYLGVGCCCYVKRDVMDTKDAVKLIRRAGGLSFFAHPHQTKLDDGRLYTLMKELKEAGLDGVEGYYSEYTPAMGEKFRNMARSLGLMLSGGSDYHAEMKPHIELGSGIDGNLFVGYEVLEAIKRVKSKKTIDK